MEQKRIKPCCKNPKDNIHQQHLFQLDEKSQFVMKIAALSNDMKVFLLKQEYEKQVGEKITE
jgi:hypothetical protein